MLGNQEALQDLMDEVRGSYSYLELIKSGNGGRFRRCCYQGTGRRRDGAIPGEEENVRDTGHWPQARQGQGVQSQILRLRGIPWHR